MSDRKKRLTKALSMALGLLSMGGQFGNVSMASGSSESNSSITHDTDYDDQKTDNDVEFDREEEEDAERLKAEIRGNIGNDLKRLEELGGTMKLLKRDLQALSTRNASSASLSVYERTVKDIDQCLSQCDVVKNEELDILSKLASSDNLDEIGAAVDMANGNLVKLEDLCKNCRLQFDSLKTSLSADDLSNKKDEDSERKLNLKSVRDRIDASLAVLDGLSDKLRANNIIGTYDNRVDGLRSSLSKLRVSSGVSDGMTEREFSMVSQQIESVNSEIEKLRNEIDDECTSLTVRTDYDVYTDTLTSLEVQWADFNKACNPGRLSNEMVETTKNQAMRSYERGKKTYEELRAMLIEKSDQACDVDGGGIVKASSQTEEVCRQTLKKLSNALALSRKMFEKAAQSNIIRPRSRSLTSERQHRAKMFFKNCRSINARDNMNEAQKKAALLGELSKLLPGREELHARLLDIVVKPVEMNKQGRVEASALQRKNMLLIGNVGTGKTEEVSRVLEAANVKSIFAKPGDFSTSESANTFWENFLKETENSTSDVVIVFDEIESILPSRWGEQEVSPAVANFNIFMDKLASKPSLMAHYRGMIGTTNLSQERLDPALVSRIANVITVPSLSGDRLVDAVAGLTRTVTFDATCSKSEVNETIADIMEKQNISIRDFINILESEVDKQHKLNVDPSTGAPTGNLVLHQDSLYASLRGLSLTDTAGGPVKA